jgi:putative transposase
MSEHDVPRPVRQEYLWQQVRRHGAEHLKRLIEAFMEKERDRHLACATHQRCPQRRGWRNGYQQRRLETIFGPLLLRKPKVRGIGPVPTLVLDRYQRRAKDVDRAVLRWLACGQSTREVSATLRQTFGTVLCAGAVSQIVARLDEEVRAFHGRPLTHGYRFLHLDAKHWRIGHRRHRRGRGKARKAVLLIAWGVRHDGREELVDFPVADSESEQCWTDFLTDLEERGVKRRNRWSQELEMIVTDGDMGLRSALWMVYPTVPKQLCAFHKVQSLAEHLKDRQNRPALLSSAAAIYEDLHTPHQALHRLQRWAEHWREVKPHAVRRMEADSEDTLTYLNAPPRWQRRLKTNNPLERLIRELNKKTNKVGAYPSARSWERATYIVWRKLETDSYGLNRPRHPCHASTPRP